MAIYVSNITIEQGFDFDTTFQLEDTRTNYFLDLTDCSVESKLRKHYAASNYVSFLSNIVTPKEGLISISLSASETINLNPGRHVFDVKIIASNKEYKVVEGSALVRAGVTR